MIFDCYHWHMHSNHVMDEYKQVQVREMEMGLRSQDCKKWYLVTLRQQLSPLVIQKHPQYKLGKPYSVALHILYVQTFKQGVNSKLALAITKNLENFWHFHFYSINKVAQVQHAPICKVLWQQQVRIISRIQIRDKLTFNAKRIIKPEAISTFWDLMLLSGA